MNSLNSIQINFKEAEDRDWDCSLLATSSNLTLGHFYSDGIGRGTRFEFKLTAYTCNRDTDNCVIKVILLIFSPTSLH